MQNKLPHLSELASKVAHIINAAEKNMNDVKYFQIINNLNLPSRD